MDELEFANKFCKDLLKHAKRKADLHDGIKAAGRSGSSINTHLFFLSFAAEELGEVASAINRERWQLARSECIDLAHTALLVAFSLNNE